MKSIATCLTILLVFATVALAADEVSLQVTAEKEVVVAEAGQQVVRRAPADTIQPGETIIFTLAYSNSGDAPATNVVFNNPVSELTRYIDGSAYGDGSDITFSVDGGQTFGALQELRVSISEGGTDSRAATAADVTHIRWVLESIPAKGSGEVGFRAQVK